MSDIHDYNWAGGKREGRQEVFEAMAARYRAHRQRWERVCRGVVVEVDDYEEDYFERKAEEAGGGEQECRRCHGKGWVPSAWNTTGNDPCPVCERRKAKEAGGE